MTFGVREFFLLLGRFEASFEGPADDFLTDFFTFFGAGPVEEDLPGRGRLVPPFFGVSCDSLDGPGVGDFDFERRGEDGDPWTFRFGAVTKGFCVKRDGSTFALTGRICLLWRLVSRRDLVLTLSFGVV